MKPTLVKVVIPIYRPLDKLEQASLAQSAKMLSRYPIVLLHPKEMDMSGFTAEYPSLETLGVSAEWLGRANGIAGYNRMCLSAAFYELFDDCEYILICQTDAWIFRDELSEWCAKGYDYVGAPWVRRAIYDLPLIKQFMALRRRLCGPTDRQLLYGKVGNGGLSLRRVESCRNACTKYAAIIEEFLSHRHHIYNEDVFWATMPSEFRYPTEREALAFAFDTNPRYCYRLMGNKLPFGCHSWTKPKMYRFWRTIIKL